MAKQKLKVKTRPGKICPRENDGVMIGDGFDVKGKLLANGGFIDMPNTPYYRSLIKDGSLITPEIEQAEKDAAEKAAAEKKK